MRSFSLVTFFLLWCFGVHAQLLTTHAGPMAGGGSGGSLNQGGGPNLLSANIFAPTFAVIDNSAATTAAASSGTSVLTFAAVPAGTFNGQYLYDATTQNTMGHIQSFTTTTVTVTPALGVNVGSNDVIYFYGNSTGYPSLSQRTISRPAASTADYYHLDGLYWTQPYDLTAMGSWGQAIATAKGYRYLWLLGADHPESSLIWGHDADGIYVGYSNDPAILPDPSTMTQIIPDTIVISSQTYQVVMVPWLVYNPDDATNHAYIYTQCFGVGGSLNDTFEECLWVRNDFNGGFTVNGISHAGAAGDFVAVQSVYRTGVNQWVSYGVYQPSGMAVNLSSFTSTNGQTFTHSANYTYTNGSTTYVSLCQDSPYVTIAGQRYSITVEDNRSSGGFMYLVQAPVDSNCNLITSGSPPVTRLSTLYQGIYPGPTYLQSVGGYYESGIYYAYAVHGFFSDVGLVVGALYANGGGLDEQYVDLYGMVLDSTAASNSAPPGVVAAASGGTVTLSWYDIIPTHTYRVKDCSTDSTCASPTTIGNPTSGSFTVSPSASTSCSIHYYQVLTLNAGVEEAGRIVGTFVSGASQFVNKHITRVCGAGADYATIDQTWLTTVDNWIENTCSCLSNLLYWTDPAFGTAHSSTVISKIFDLGTTFLPRGGDYTTNDTNTTYSSNGFGANGVPEWIGGATAHGYYGSGRLNQIRRWTSGYTVLASYSASGSSTLWGFGEFCCQKLQTATSGITWYIGSMNGGPPWVLNPTQALSSHTTQINGGTFDGTTATPYVEGVAGTSQSPAQDTTPTFGQIGSNTNIFFLQMGATNSKFVSNSNAVGGTYSYDDNSNGFNGSDMIMFQGNLASLSCGASNCMASLTSLIRTRVGN